MKTAHNFMPRPRTWFNGALSGILLLFSSSSFGTLVYMDSFLWHDPASQGQIQVTEEVFNNYFGDYSLYNWRYTIHNLSYDPFPGRSNGLSGFNIVFPYPLPELSNQYGPAGWELNCCAGSPPFSAEWDIRNSLGMGIPIGGFDIFGFTTAPRYDVISEGSWMHSWINNSQSGTFSGPISTPGELRPVPEPADLLLLSLGLLIMGCYRLCRVGVH